MKEIMLLVAVAALAGCGKPEAPKPAATPIEKKISAIGGTAQDAINGMTGKTAVDQGKKAQEKIRAVATQEHGDLNEVLK